MSIKDYLTIVIEGQLFGIEAVSIHDVFYINEMTPVPLAREDVDGVLNLRGRIVTAVCARKRMGMGPRPDSIPNPLAIALEINGDMYALIVDSVSEVMKLDENRFHQPPGNLPPRWSETLKGVYQLENDLLILLEPSGLFEATIIAKAA
jgi:purine-binding chemotaxis protein CheW